MKGPPKKKFFKLRQSTRRENKKRCKEFFVYFTNFETVQKIHTVIFLCRMLTFSNNNPTLILGRDEGSRKIVTSFFFSTDGIIA